MPELVCRQNHLTLIFPPFFVAQTTKSAACLRATHRQTLGLAQTSIGSYLSLQRFNALRIPEALGLAQTGFDTAGMSSKRRDSPQ